MSAVGDARKRQAETNRPAAPEWHPELIKALDDSLRPWGLAPRSVVELVERLLTEERKRIAQAILGVCACDEDTARDACNVAITRAARIAHQGAADA